MASGPLALAPEIDTFRQQFEQISAEATALVAPLDDVQFHWRPGAEVWSVGQCLEHLNIAARLYLPALDESIADSIRRGVYGEGPFRYTLLGRLWVWLVQPPARIRTKAPAHQHPAPSRPRSEIMAAFRAYQVQFVDRLRQANGLDLGRARVASPVSRWVRFSLGSGFALVLAHERRHLAQARQLTRSEQFPGGAGF